MESAQALPQPPQSCTKQPATSLSVKLTSKNGYHFYPHLYFHFISGHKTLGHDTNTFFNTGFIFNSQMLPSY